MRRNSPVFCLLTLLFLAAGPTLWAQGNLGGLTGNVVDSSGALIPEATLTLRSAETNAVSSTTATSSGVYAFHALPPGVYRLEAEKAGFKKFVREQVPVL